MAKEMEDAQRLLFLFAKGTNMLGEGTSSYESGTIEAVMCVDKSPEELTTFEDLVNEADQYTKKWNFIFTTALSGQKGQSPSDQEVDAALTKMSNIFNSGEDLSRFVVWDRQEQSVVIT